MNKNLFFSVFALFAVTASYAQVWYDNPPSSPNTYFLLSGNVGIGNAAPTYKLDVAGNIRADITNAPAFMTKSSLGPSIQQVNLGGDFVVAENYLSVFSRNIHHDGTNWIRRNQYGTAWATVMNQVYYDVTFTPSNGGGSANEVVNPNSLFRILSNGNVGIGTTMPGSFKLAVEGKIGASEIKVTLQRPWPDYVFNKAYSLPAILDVAAFIEKNNHLPGIPSAKEVKENGGVDLGDMTTRLLEKIEQLTLYVIELKKENAAIKATLANINSH